MKQWRIKHRILFLAMFPVIVIASLLTIVDLIGGITEIDNALNTRGTAMVRQLAPASEYGVFSGNREILQTLVQSIMKEADVKSVVITDNHNKIIAVSGRPGRLVEGSKEMVSRNKDGLIFSAPIHQYEIEVDDYGLLDRTLRSENRKQKILGQVYVELSTLSTDQRKFQFILADIIIGLLGVTGAFLMALNMSRDVTTPLSRLLDAVTRMAEGDLNTRVSTNSGGELAELENGFNAMASELKTAHATMQHRIDEATAMLTHQASHDSLTELVNRREFEKRLEHAFTRTREQGVEHVVCYMDLDKFKAVNDACGHVAGDELLRQITRLLHQNVRDRDTLARLGGDEFGLLLESCTLEDSIVIAEKFRQLVTDFSFVWNEKIFNVGVSIGLVAINRSNANLIDAMSAADAACYAAKNGGRNRVHVCQT